MKKQMETAVMSIGFYWLGLTAAPAAALNAETVRLGLIGSTAALTGFAFVGYTTRSPKSPPSPPAD